MQAEFSREMGVYPKSRAMNISVNDALLFVFGFPVAFPILLPVPRIIFPRVCREAFDSKGSFADAKFNL